MRLDERLLEGYENSRLINYTDLPDKGNCVKFSDLKNAALPGVLKADFYADGELTQHYTSDANHVAVIAATRLGKTTSYIIPTVISFARQKVKKSMIISDPKGEIYRHTANALREEGYDVRLLNFRDNWHTECWNPLTPIFRKYRSAADLENEVKIVDDNGVEKYSFADRIYDNLEDLEREITMWKKIKLEDVGNDIDTIAAMLTTGQENVNDPYWVETAEILIKAFLWAMLEDSDSTGNNRITEDTFSFNTMLNVFGSFPQNGDTFSDNGYFTSRGADSRAYSMVKSSIIDNAKNTRACILSEFNTLISVFRDSAVRVLTSCNSFELKDMTARPTALFINYRDEVKMHYKIISLFVQDAYRTLIGEANEDPEGKLKEPFYFILDEFGNFPAIRDFDVTISACGGRNIFFILALQSYAQLDAVYGSNVAAIIKDNLNMHVFIGSNNTPTLEQFSAECGKVTRLAPLSLLKGETEGMETCGTETIPLVPVSKLTHFDPGECIITEANCGYVTYSKLERYYLCKEFDVEKASTKDYVSPINPFDQKYEYTYKVKPSRYNWDD